MNPALIKMVILDRDKKRPNSRPPGERCNAKYRKNTSRKKIRIGPILLRQDTKTTKLVQCRRPATYGKYCVEHRYYEITLGADHIDSEPEDENEEFSKK